MQQTNSFILPPKNRQRPDCNKAAATHRPLVSRGSAMWRDMRVLQRARGIDPRSESRGLQEVRRLKFIFRRNR
jgi:hypothetical protein